MHSEEVSELDLEIVGVLLQRFAVSLIFVLPQAIEKDLSELVQVKRRAYLDHVGEHLERLVRERILNALMLVVGL